MFPRHASLHPTTGETVKMDARHIMGVEAELEDGQSWDDRISVDMTREQWTMAIISLMTQAHELQDGVDRAMSAARDGELTAVLMTPHLIDSHRLMASVIKSLTETVFPEIAEKAQAEFDKRRAEARANADA